MCETLLGYFLHKKIQSKNFFSAFFVLRNKIHCFPCSICTTCDKRCYYQSEETWVVRFWLTFPKRFSKSYLEWTIIYLCEIEQFVQVDDKISSSLKANFRFTQGSIMGPLFFNIYAPVLQSTVTNRCQQYAVDTTLYAHAKPIQLDECISSIKSDLIIKRCQKVR